MTAQAQAFSAALVLSAEADAVTEVVMALFDGLANRSVQNPDLDKADVARVMRVALQAILSA